MTLSLVPCDHYWIAVRTTQNCVLALCKFKFCQKKAEFTTEEWGVLVKEGQGANSPIRV